MTEYLRSLHEQAEIAKIAGALENRQHVRDRSKRYQEAAVGCGFDIIPPTGNVRHTSVGAQSPSIASLIERLIPSMDGRLSKTIWKLPSAITHGTTFAVLQLFETLDVDLIDGRPGAQLQDNPEFVTQLGRLSLLGYTEFFRRVTHVYRWDPQHWRNKMARWALRLRSADLNGPNTQPKWRSRSEQRFRGQDGPSQ